MSSRGFLLLIFTLLVSSSCQKNKKDALAYIDGLEVTEKHFTSAFKEYYYKTGQAIQPSLDIKSDILDAEFNVYVLAAHALNSGLADELSSQKKLGLIKRKVFVDEYLEREVLNNVKVSEKDLREIFLRFNSRLRASHIYAEDKGTAEALYDRLQKGESFEALAKETFQNSYLANNAGDLGEFTIDEMDIAFENAAFNLKIGEISKPVKTKSGYSIIKLTDAYTTPIVTEYQFSSTKNQFEAFAYQRNKELAIREHLKKTVDSFKINEKLLQVLWSEIENGISVSENYRLNIPGIANSDEILIEYGNFIFTFDDLLFEGFYSPVENLKRINSYHRFTEFVKGLAYRTFMVKEFRKKYDEDAPEISGSISQTYYEFLHNRVEEKLKNEIQLSEAELKEEFFANKDYYDFPLMINAARIVVDSQEKGLEVVAALEDGKEWSEVLKQYTIENKDLLINGELGLQPIQNFGAQALNLVDLQEGDIAGPLAYQTGKLMIYKILEVQEPREADFNEVKELVDRVLRQKRFKDERKKLIESVKSDYGAVVNYKKLNSITINL